MAIFFQKKERHVIPNWRSFENTAQLGELNASDKLELSTSYKPDISDLLEEWRHLKNIGLAGDLLGVGITCNQQENPIIQEISDYILLHRSEATSALITAAYKIKDSQNEKKTSSFEINSIDSFLLRKNLSILYERINFFKKRLISNPRNPVAWVELARLYAINGQDLKAEKAMKNALFLAPENRFVLRNMARFFAHIGDIEFAHDFIRKSKLVNIDPWLMATEISLADMRERGSRFTKQGVSIVNSNSFHPFNISELSSAIATLEMKNGNIKASRNFFDKSLIHPNDNSLAQAEWASQEDSKLLTISPKDFCIHNSFEALARNEFEHDKWEKAIEFSKLWFLDLPFSKTSILFGSSIASCKLKDHEQAVNIAKLGLISHPNDPQLLNNIAYSLSFNNQLEEAEKMLNQIRKEDCDYGDINSICIIATKGLLHFRQGNKEKGRNYYLKALELTKYANDHYFNSLALVNYIREEIIANDIEIKDFIPKINEIRRHYKGKDIADLADDVLKMYDESTNTQHRI